MQIRNREDLSTVCVAMSVPSLRLKAADWMLLSCTLSLCLSSRVFEPESIAFFGISILVCSIDHLKSSSSSGCDEEWQSDCLYQYRCVSQVWLFCSILLETKRGYFFRVQTSLSSSRKRLKKKLSSVKVPITCYGAGTSALGSNSRLLYSLHLQSLVAIADNLGV